MDALPLLFIIAGLWLVNKFNEASNKSDWRKSPSGVKPSPTKRPKPRTTPLENFRNKKKQFLKKEFRSKLNSHFDFELTEDQLDTVVDNSQHAQVVASAGSGKTTTIIVKYAFLIKSGLAKNDEILILAFNRSIKEEISKRIKDMFDKDPEVFTFHGFGKSIIEGDSGKKCSVSAYANESEDGLIQTQNIKKLIEKAVIDKDNYGKNIKRNILFFRALTPYQNTAKFAKSKQEYDAIVSTYPYKRNPNSVRDPLTIPALDGVSFVKSQEELQIANYLTLMSVDFEYEKTIRRKDGQDINPDFYYRSHHLYHEHFAINKNKKAPPYFENYVEIMEQKQAFFQRAKEEGYLDYFFTYSYQFEDGTIFESINNELRQRGIELQRANDAEIEERLKNFEQDDVYVLFQKAIKLAKAMNISPQRYEELLEDVGEKVRANYFKWAFIPIFEQYQKELQKTQEIDYEDMINLALSSNSKLKNKYKYILVDEYQDISNQRYDLLHSLGTKKKPKIFQVGDDWQSIYRFTGANNAKMHDFENKDLSKLIKYATSAKEMLNKIKKGELALNLKNYLKFPDPFASSFFIENNFRTEISINELATKFILKNRFQLNKKPVSTVKNHLNKPINFVEIDEYTPDVLNKILSKIPQNSKIQNVFILGKKKWHIKPETVGNFKRSSRNDLNIETKTVHKSKGLEADHVIILGNEGGLKGFPFKLDNDPLLEPLLPNIENFEDAEERRVMYVALTRAKMSVFIVHELKNPSSFVEELKILVEEEKLPYKTYNFSKRLVNICPECKKNNKSGFLIIVSNKSAENKMKPSIQAICENKRDYGCKYKEKAPCRVCKEEGRIGYWETYKDEKIWQVKCNNSSCKFKEPFHGSYFKFLDKTKKKLF